MNYKYVAMIPARMGSKRIPLKNIRYIGDKPLIKYPIDLALGSGLFESIWVNSEDERLGEVAEKYGVNFHKRPTELSTDTATNREFTYEFLQKHECDYVIMINPTSPLLRENTLKAFIDFVDDSGDSPYNTVLSVTSMKEELIYKGEPLNFSYKEKVNSQMLEPIESVCWALTAWRREGFIKMQDEGINPVFGGKVGRFVIPKDECCDLDTMEDWRIAEGILMSRKIELKEKYLDL